MIVARTVAVMATFSVVRNARNASSLWMRSWYQCVVKPVKSVRAARLVEAEHDEHDDREEEEREDENRVQLEIAGAQRALRAHSASSPTRRRYTKTPSRMNTISSTDMAEPSGQF